MTRSFCNCRAQSVRLIVAIVRGRVVSRLILRSTRRVRRAAPNPHSPPTRNLTPARKFTGSAGYPTTSLYRRSSAFATFAYRVTRG